ncbi:penicillin-binding protein, partial [Streptomyces halstedii]
TDERKNAWFVGYTPNLSGAVWVGSASQRVHMVGISIGGVYHDKVYGGEVPGPIWRDLMTGALVGKDAPPFNKVDIPDLDKDKNRDKGRDDDGNGDQNGNPGGTVNGATTLGNTISGQNDGGGGTFPTPSFSIPEGFIQGNSNSGTGNGGNGNGGNGDGGQR